jgi:hypothetical protein
MVMRQLAHPLSGAVGGIIVDEEDLETETALERQEFVNDGPDVVALVEGG